jgi:uncharacterized damage-inducible protein DinB
MKEIMIAGFKKHVFSESYQRIFDCVNMIDETEVWFTPNQSSNSVGVLIIHLIGNAQQWIVSTLGGLQDNRNRQAEFESINSFNKKELLSALAELKERIVFTLDELTEEKLIQTYHVQCYDETGYAILLHVIEHFSYHTGQIAQLTKLIKNQQLGFYDDKKLINTQ